METQNPMQEALPANLGNVYELLFESAAEGLLVVDGHGTILLANHRSGELFGYAEGELEGMKVEALVPAARRSQHDASRAAYMKHPVRRSMGLGMDLSGCRKDGSTFPVEIALNVLPSQGDNLVMALITDITKRKQAEEQLARLNVELEMRVAERTRELKASQRLYHQIARNFPNGTINVFDRKLDYEFVEGRELFRRGVTSEQLVGTNYLDHLDPQLGPLIRENLIQVFDGKDLTFEIEKDGNLYELQCVGLRGFMGEIHQILVVEHDITQQKQAEEDIRKALEKEKELNELKSRFVSMASHEFRTPLSTILTSLSLIAKYESPEDSEKRHKHLNRIRSSVHNLTSILNDFLSLDKLETGRVIAHPHPTDLPTLLAEVAEEMQAIAKAGQKVHTHFQGISEVVLDPSMLRNILINLVSNAIKYSAEDKSVEIKCISQENKITIHVIDQGIGIPDTEKAHMFERFFRAKNATNIQGTGLGLNIIRKYLDLMQGDITFQSTENIGSTFTVTLPLQLPQ